jgi:hypothetical protein
MIGQAKEFKKKLDSLLKEYDCKVSAEEWGSSVFFTFSDESYLELNEELSEGYVGNE